jgi:UDP:flavonoid glycosyltransferase YjiC (YdhE family)
MKIMMSIDTLISIFTLATEPWSTFHSGEPPTSNSIRKIQQELGIHIPEDYERIAASCPSYGVWLAGLGEDYEHPFHILKLNQIFHLTSDDSPALPQNLIMINLGFDEDFDCWNTKETTIHGEHPIIYISLGSEPNGRRFESFREYIEDFALSTALSNPKTRPRAKKLIET